MVCCCVHVSKLFIVGISLILVRAQVCSPGPCWAPSRTNVLTMTYRFCNAGKLWYKPQSPSSYSYVCRQQPQHCLAGQTGGRSSGLQAGGQPLMLGKGRGSLALPPLAARPRAAEATSWPWCTTRTWLTCGATASVRLVLQRTIAVDSGIGAAWPTAVASQGTPGSRVCTWHAPPAWSQSPPAPPASAVRG